MAHLKSEDESRAVSPNLEKSPVIIEILGKRTRQSKLEYKVRWKSLKTTWESKESLQCSSLIEVVAFFFQKMLLFSMVYFTIQGI
jgi:hypothetical protein